MVALLTSPLRRLALQSLAPIRSASAWDWSMSELRREDNTHFDERRALLFRHWYDIFTARITGIPKVGDPWAHRCEQLYLVTIAQLAKTQTAVNCLLWALANHPRNAGLYFAREKDYRRTRRRMLVPMIERSPALASLLPSSEDARSLALGTDCLTLGHVGLYLLNGKLIDDWRSLPLPLIVADEMEQYPVDCEEQGDPIELGLIRQTTFPHDSLFFGVTSPASIRGHGWRRLLKGSHERPLVACPDCSGLHWLDWRLIVPIDPIRKLAEISPDEIRNTLCVRWTCPWCGCLHDDNAVRAMVLNCCEHSRWIPGTWTQSDDDPDGKWTALPGTLDSAGRLIHYVPPETAIRSGWAPGLYSVHQTLSRFAADLVDKRLNGTEETAKTWTNARACEPWTRIFVENTTDDIAAASASTYALGTCPVEAERVVVVFDQQGNTASLYNWPWIARALCADGSSYLVGVGRADSPEERDEVEDRLWPIGRRRISADLVAMDSANPNARQDVYLWASERPDLRVCLRGDDRMRVGETWREVPPPRPGERKTSRPADVREWLIHPHFWRSQLHACVLHEAPAPAWFMPSDTPARYQRSLTSEVRAVELRRVTGGGYEEVIVWKPREIRRGDGRVSVRKDQHWADCEKMFLALCEIRGWRSERPSSRGPTATDTAPETVSAGSRADDWIDAFTKDWGV